MTIVPIPPPDLQKADGVVATEIQGMEVVIDKVSLNNERLISGDAPIDGQNLFRVIDCAHEVHRSWPIHLDLAADGVRTVDDTNHVLGSGFPPHNDVRVLTSTVKAQFVRARNGVTIDIIKNQRLHVEVSIHIDNNGACGSDPKDRGFIG